MHRLYARIYAHMLLVLVAAAVAVVAITLVRWHGEYGRGMAQRATELAAYVVGEHLDEPAARDALVARLSRDFDVDVTLHALDDRLLVATGTPLPPLEVRERERFLAGEGDFSRGRARAAVRTRAGHVAAVLQVRARRWPRHSPVTPVGYVAVVLAVIALAALPLARRISRPVARLTEATRRFGAGELGHRIPAPPVGARRGDELGRLVDSWNEMAGRIETLVRAQRELLANVSHELRSPLARLRLMLELLPGAAEDRDRALAFERELEDLDRLIDAALTVARLDTAELPVARAELDARRLLESVRDNAAGHPAFAGEAVRVEAPAGLVVAGDEVLLRRALWNLLENAGKYGAPPLVLFGEQAGAGVRLGVLDHGPGIAPDERERVTRPFVRGATARAASPNGGFGLGLTLASRIAAAHGGELAMESLADGREWRIALVLPRPVAAGAGRAAPAC